MMPHGLKALDVAFVLLIVVIIGVMVYVVCCDSSDPRVAELRDKLDAVKRLNKERVKAQPPAPPVDLVELNVAKWRAEYLAKHAIIGPYDAEGRHPVYWYARLDGGLYGVEETFIWIGYYLTSPEELKRESFRSGMEYALRHKGGALLNPCYNYIAMEMSHRYGGGPRRSGIKFYVFMMIAKWVDWTSPPIYVDGRFTAEGYAHPVMKPVALVVRYAPHNPPRRDEIRERYNLGGVQFCRYFDPLAGSAPCKDAQELMGTFVVSKVLDDDRWHVKIDVSVSLNRTGLYTFELIAEDLRAQNLRAQNRKCVIMHYTVEVPSNRRT